MIMCDGCQHGIVQQRRSEKGKQDPRMEIFCLLKEREMPPDLSYCSAFRSERTPINSWDRMPIPVVIEASNESVRRTVSTTLGLAIQQTGQVIDLLIKRRR